jgi:hypothetical protein
MPNDDDLQIRLMRAEALVLFEWLTRTDSAKLLPTEHPAEQKVLWLLEGQLEKQLLEVFSPNYDHLVEGARKQVDATH